MYIKVFERLLCGADGYLASLSISPNDIQFGHAQLLEHDRRMRGHEHLSLCLLFILFRFQMAQQPGDSVGLQSMLNLVN